MPQSKLGTYFFFALLLGMLWLSFSILKPFAYGLVLATVFAVIFQGLYKRVLGLLRGRSISAFITVIIVLITILVPIVLFGMQVFHETEGIYSYIVENGGRLGFTDRIETFIHRVQDYTTFDEQQPDYFSFDLGGYIEKGLNWLLQNLGSIFSSFAFIGVNIFVFLLTFYYLLKDGSEMRRRMISLSPLNDKYDEGISSKMELAINSVIKGSIVIAVIQGFLTGFGLFIFGVPNPAFWGSIAAMAALIPGVGTALVSIPAIIYLLATGHGLSALGLGIWAIIAVGLVDNILFPKLVQRNVRIHSLFILLFVFGGLTFFGPMGFLLGPVILSLLAALLDVYILLVEKGEIHKITSSAEHPG